MLKSNVLQIIYKFSKDNPYFRFALKREHQIFEMVKKKLKEKKKSSINMAILRYNPMAFCVILILPPKLFLNLVMTSIF